MKCKIFAAALMLTASITANASAPIPIANFPSQQACTLSAITAPNALWNTGGVESLNRSLDRKILKRDVVAYKIQWSTGWSGWYVKGVNDLVNVMYPNNLPVVGGHNARLFWIYASDHNWQYLSCATLP